MSKRLSFMALCLLAACCKSAFAFDPVVIRGVDFVNNLPLPAHHGIVARIKPIEDPNLTAFKVLVSSDGGNIWVLYDDRIKPYNTESITIMYRGRLYGLSTQVPYKIQICAIYGSKGEQCSQADVTLPLIADNAALDDDGDLLSRQFEYNHGTDPLNPDSDNDDMSDRVELALGLDPNLTQLPAIEIAGKNLNFGTGNAYGDAPDQHQAVVVKNNGNRPLRIFNILFESASGAFIASDNYKAITNIAPGNEVAVNLDFLPKAPGAALGNLVLLTDDRAQFPATVELSGTGKNISNMFVDFSDPKIDFGSIVSGAAINGPSIPVNNIASDQPLNVSAHIEGSLNFLVTPDSLVVKPGESGEFKTFFHPDWSGTHEGILRIQGKNDAAFAVAVIPMAATVTGAEPAMRASTGRLTYPATQVGSSSEGYVAIYNDGEGYLFIKGIDMGTDENKLPVIGGRKVFTPSSRQMVVPPHSSRPLKVTFKPHAAAAYSTQMCIVGNGLPDGIPNNCDVIRNIGGVVPFSGKMISIQLAGEGK